MIRTNILLGAIAGITIFLGLPVARWRRASERLRGLLTLTAAGVLLFLIIEVGYQAMESVEATAKAGSISAALYQSLIFVVGILAGLVGLAWLEAHRARRLATGAEALEIATMIAIGIGLHNFAEGLAIGQSFAGGAVSLGTVLVIGFALHNATEGFGIAGPLAGHEVSWGRLLWLGLIGGGPTALGAMIGGVWVNRSIELLFLSLAVGSLIYVARELFRIRFQTLGVVGAMTAVAIGLFIGFGTELVAEVAQSRATMNAATSKPSAVLRFANQQVEPSSIAIARGASLSIENGGSVPLVFEGNGLYTGEVVVSAGSKVVMVVTGAEGQYRLIDERGQSGTATISVQPGGTREPLTDEVNAVGALTVLEGHVRASKELHDRGASGKGPDPVLDLKRAGKHAGHPQHELLMGSDPDALTLQQLLRARGVFDQLNNALTSYVSIAPDGKADLKEIDQRYQAALAATEQARRAIAVTAYDTPEFRARVIRFVLDTANGEYATATEGGHITIIEPGVPGKDNFIEYQDARGFIQAANDLTGPLGAKVTGDSRGAMNELLLRVFATLDPRDVNNPIPATEVETLINHVKGGLGA